MVKNGTWKSVVIWSVISAAFIGPGTVTTAVSAGSAFGLDLLWAVVLATLACIVLQEVAARISIASGMNLGQALKIKFGPRAGYLLQWLIGGSVIAGCAAYEAGNILGAVSGLELLTGLPARMLTIIIAVVIFILLWKGSPAWISGVMMFLVVTMGLTFIRVAFIQDVSTGELVEAALFPIIPPGGELLLLGLIGTTIVPYNIFVGTGISKGQTIPMMRLGLTISILIGGMITAAILVAGTVVSEFNSFRNLYDQFELKVGVGAAIALATGLFAAGFSSSITSPYAASIIGRTVFEVRDEKVSRGVWLVVLATGFVIAVSGLKPIPVILFVQALNGLILPLLVIFLILVVNDAAIIPSPYRHSMLYNLLLISVLGAVLLISLNNIDKAVVSAFGLSSAGHLTIVIVLTAAILMVVASVIFLKKEQK